MIAVSKSNIRIQANPQKVLARYLKYGGEERIRRIVSTVLSMEDGAAEETLFQVLEEFGNIRAYTADVSPITPSCKLLLGSYFTHEYSVESAALFNPSIVNHPDQSGLTTGEGHISSIEFTSGVVSGEGEISLDPSPLNLVSGRISEQNGPDSDYSITFKKETLLGNRVIFPVSPDESNGLQELIDELVNS